MKKAEVVVVPLPLMGHMVSALEFSKLLLARDDRFLVTVLIMNPIKDPNLAKFITHSLTLSSSFNSDGIRFLQLPALEDDTATLSITSRVQAQKPRVKDIVSRLTSTTTTSSSSASPDHQSSSSSSSTLGHNDSPRLAAFVLDMFSTGLMEVASDFGVPWYVYFSSGAAFLGCMLYLGNLLDQQRVDLTEFKDSDAELPIPSLANPLPGKLLPALALDTYSLPVLHYHALKLGEARGVIVNTFLELESHALHSLAQDRRSSSKTPPVYPVGPILNLKKNKSTTNVNDDEYEDVMQWLDKQATSSVVFLCFGSWGNLDEDQVKELALALERCGYPFLWSLRQPPPKGTFLYPSNYTNLGDDIFPDGFLDRTAEIGKVIGWAPQADILAHPAVGGFVSHCGWNSILESVWFGVPLAAWPMYAEQQFNAFQVVMELGLGTEIKLDYRKSLTGDGQVLVSAQEIEKGIRVVMEYDSEARRRVQEMSEKGRKAMMSGGSSHSALGTVIQDILERMN
ncbi:hypothetical protein Tsubulata_026120 [Turnera subulata]|uniref:Glycosyltransferase n=1 Tax=Turnera subulata TaxID=218843 RepID=A0A9Q0J3K9_9ROSI|nr:hypothetical protein Tsubulata_026120 [Turnera subulata]